MPPGWPPESLTTEFGPVAGPVAAAFWFVWYPVYLIHLSLLTAQFGRAVGAAAGLALVAVANGVAAVVSGVATACAGCILVLLLAGGLLVAVVALRGDRGAG